MSADDNAPEQAREVEVVRGVLAEHLPMVWSDRTVGCHGCSTRAEHALPFDRAEWRRLLHGDDEPGWTWHQHHVAEKVSEALAPIRAAERQEAARAALIEAAGDIAERIAAVVDPDSWRRDGFDEGWAHAGEKIDGLLRARADGVTGRSGT